MNTPILEVSDIQKYYGNKGNITKAVNRISLSAHKGEFVGIMGASGSGKTTLLNCISTIDTVTSGKIFVEGKDITTLRGKQLSAFRREKLGFIFQQKFSRWLLCRLWKCSLTMLSYQSRTHP